MRRTVAINLSLLEDLELLPSYRYAGLSWSYSRREVLDQCTRRYFYQYYWDALKDPKLREHARNLRGIKNRHLRAGDLVHLAVSTYLKKRKQGTTLPVDWLTRWARSLFAKDQQYSKHLRAGGHAINRRFPPAALDEILNDVGNGSALLKEADEQMVLCIRNFFEPVFADLRELGALPRSFIEHKLALKGFPAPVSGKIDLAVRCNGGATIVDWKLGRATEGGAESLRLATYGLWATEVFGVPDSEVRISKAHLGAGDVVEFQADDQAFRRARVRIHQDLERMVVLHEYGQTGVVEAFTPVPQSGVCRLCPFRRICPEAMTYAGN